MPQLELVLLVGGYAQRWHLADGRRKNATSPHYRATLTTTVAAWREIYEGSPSHGRSPDPGRSRCRFIPLPHPSWRNNGWLKANPWFAAELLPVLQRAVAAAV
jgi:uracil-DNA glycosylase